MKIIFIIGLVLFFVSGVNSQVSDNKKQTSTQNENIRITSDDRTNSLIIRAPIAVQKQIEQIVRELDRTNQTSNEIKVFQLVHQQASELVPILQNVMAAYKPSQIRSSQFELKNNAWNQSLHGLVLNDDRTNKIIVITDKLTASNFEILIKELDTKQNLLDNTFINKLKNANSSQIANLINSIYNRR